MGAGPRPANSMIVNSCSGPMFIFILVKSHFGFADRRQSEEWRTAISG
jgi:hypothetical protein